MFMLSAVVMGSIKKPTLGGGFLGGLRGGFLEV